MAFFRSKGFCIVTGTAIVGLTAIGSFLAGGIVGQGQLYHSRFLREEKVLASVIQATPEFANLRIEEASNGVACLVGKVPSNAALERLDSAIRDQLGQLNLRDRMAAVHVEQTVGEQR